MKENMCQKANSGDRKNERGAALISVLMISFLLLVAVASLLLEASMNAANVSDATSEEQAYYAAESGIQSVVDVLRNNRAPSTLIDPSKSPYPPDPNAHPANRLDYFKAVRLATSNAPGDTGTTARLSRWLPYDANFTDRIILGDPATYSPLNGFAYSVTVSDPDNTDNTIIFTTGGKIGEELTATNIKTWTDFGGEVTITYNPKTTPVVVDVSTGIGNTDLGTFSITTTGTGATIPERVRFQIVIAYSTPQNTKKVIRGYIEPGFVDSTSVGNVRIFYDSEVFVTFGSLLTLTNGVTIQENPPAPPTGPYGTYLAGYRVVPNPPNGTPTLIEATMTSPEPTRLLIRSTGFGPHGSQKQLESVIQKNYFNGLGAPSPLTLIGPRCTSVLVSPGCDIEPTASTFNFDPGNSTPIEYSGKDQLLRAFLPPIGVTNDLNLAIVRAQTNSFNGKVFGSSSNIADELPYWLQSPRNLHDTLTQLKSVAQASGTYWGPASSPPNNGVYGDWTNATGITYVDKSVTISQDGGGILVVNGKLTFNGDFRFNGLVVIVGPAGFDRTGGGAGILAGNMVVAPYNDWGRNVCSINPFVLDKTKCFLSPRYEISGGGNSTIIYNSGNVANGLNGLSNFVKGVAEK